MNGRVPVAKPSARAFRALKRAGYAYKTTSRGATKVTGRIIRQRKTFMGLGYTSRKVVPLKRR